MALQMLFATCNNCSTLIQQLQYFDSLTDVGFGGVLGILYLIVIGGSLFLIQKAFAAEKAASVSLLITSIIGILLAIIGLASAQVIYICIILFVISLFLLIRMNDSYGF